MQCHNKNTLSSLLRTNHRYKIVFSALFFFLAYVCYYNQYYQCLYVIYKWKKTTQCEVDQVGRILDAIDDGLFTLYRATGMMHRVPDPKCVNSYLDTMITHKVCLNYYKNLKIQGVNSKVYFDNNRKIFEIQGVNSKGKKLTIIL
jgi:hypothetical protein